MGQRPGPGSASELLACGPFLGVDYSTVPYFLDPYHAADSINVLPNAAFQGFTTILGRQHAFLGAYSSSLFGFAKWTRVGDPDIYVGAVSGGLQFSPLMGTPANLTFPSGVTWAGSETSFVPYQEWLFATNGVGTPVKIDSSLNMTRWGIVPPSAATVAAGSSGSLNGTYFYIITFFNAFQESSAGTTSASVVVTNQEVNLSAIPTSSDPQVTGRNIYRFGGTMQTIQLVGTITDNTTTTFTDNVADVNVTGQDLVEFRDPPQAFFAICAHQGRIWGFGYSGTAVGEPSSIQGTSDLWYTNFEEPWGFNGTDQVIPIGRNAGSDIGVEVVSYMNVLYALKSRSFWAVYGSTPADYTQLRLFPTGCASKKSVVQAGTPPMLFWATPEKSIVMYNGSNIIDISDNRQTGAKSSIKGVLNTFSLADMEAVTSFAYDQGVAFSFPTQGITFYFNIPDGQWYKLSFATDRVAYDTENANEVTASEPGTGIVDSWFASAADLGQPVTGTYISRITDSGKPDATKRYRYENLIAPIQNAAATVTLLVNPGTGELSNTQLVNLSAGPEKHQLSLPPAVASGQLAQIAVIVSSLVGAVTIYRLSLSGWIERQFISTG
jgi:hypothetical protein